MSKLAYCYCLTINNPTPKCVEVVLNLDRTLNTNLLTHLIYGIEGIGPYGNHIGERMRTAHYQMAMCFNQPTPWRDVKLLFPRAHIEQLKYTYPAAAAYCRKEGVYFELGSMEAALDLIALSKCKTGDKGVSITPRSPSCLTPPPVRTYRKGSEELLNNSEANYDKYDDDYFTHDIDPS